MLTFEKREATTLENLGSLKTVVGKGGSMAFIPKNLADPNKRVAIVLTKKDGTSALVSCSDAVSKAIRAKEITKEQIAGLEIVQNDDGIAFVAMPQSAALVEFKLDAIATKAFEPKVLTEEALADLLA